MRIEPGDREDADAVADLWVDLATDQRGHGSHLLAEANRKRVRESALRHAVTGGLVVASEDDDVVGFVTFEPGTGRYREDAERGFVRNLYVVPERRGEGVGSRLLSAAEEALADAGCDTVALEAMAANDRARAFYRRHGYEPHRVEFEKALGSDGSTSDGG